jgi:hypothetical protein
VGEGRWCLVAGSEQELMATHSQKLAWYGDLICGKNRIDITFMGRSPVRIIPQALDAVRALEAALLDNGYVLPIGATGSYACRKIAGTDTWSLHSIPAALDVDYPHNPVQNYQLERGFGSSPDFTITERQVEAVEAIVNLDGVSIWKWLGWRPRKADPMHFELDVPRDKLEVADMDYRTVENVPDADWARNVIDYSIDVTRILREDVEGNDWLKNADYGQLWTMFKRYDQALKDN